MAESENIGVIPLAVLGLVLGGIAVALVLAAHLSCDKVLEEAFAATAEATMDVVVVGAVARWFQWRAGLRAQKSGVLRELLTIRDKVLEAAFLFDAHQSAKTWTEQTRELIRFVPRLEDLLETATELDLTEVVAQLSKAKNDLTVLKEEYRKSHEQIDGLGRRWNEILQAAPMSDKLLLQGDSTLLKALGEATRLLKKQLRP